MRSVNKLAASVLLDFRVHIGKLHKSCGFSAFDGAIIGTLINSHRLDLNARFTRLNSLEGRSKEYL